MGIIKPIVHTDRSSIGPDTLLYDDSILTEIELSFLNDRRAKYRIDPNNKESKDYIEDSILREALYKNRIRLGSELEDPSFLNHDGIDAYEHYPTIDTYDLGIDDPLRFELDESYIYSNYALWLYILTFLILIFSGFPLLAVAYVSLSDHSAFLATWSDDEADESAAYLAWGNYYTELFYQIDKEQGIMRGLIVFDDNNLDMDVILALWCHKWFLNYDNMYKKPIPSIYLIVAFELSDYNLFISKYYQIIIWFHSKSNNNHLNVKLLNNIKITKFDLNYDYYTYINSSIIYNIDEFHYSEFYNDIILSSKNHPLLSNNKLWPKFNY